MRHTPAPWKLEAIFPTKKEFEPRVSITAFDPEFKAVVRLADIPDVQSPDSEEMSNARLIAAAPELLDALKAIVSYLPDRNDMLNDAACNEGRATSYHIASLKVREAIYKAEVAA